MQYDRTPREGEIIRPANTAAPDSIAEPTLTLSQLQELLREAAAIERAQRSIVIHAAPETAPAPAKLTYPAHVAARAGHQQVELNLSNVVFLASLPANLDPLPPVPTSRSFAPLAFLVTGTAFIASIFGTAVTGGNPVLIAASLALLAGTGLAFSRIVGNGVNR